MLVSYISSRLLFRSLSKYKGSTLVKYDLVGFGSISVVGGWFAFRSGRLLPRRFVHRRQQPFWLAPVALMLFSCSVGPVCATGSVSKDYVAAILGSLESVCSGVSLYGSKGLLCLLCFDPGVVHAGG
ncbi:hypothetical protein QL285_070146 [Trifolium repens]|nr:hypothetical protein QL285_070146 [Trifolium repens]